MQEGTWSNILVVKVGYWGGGRGVLKKLEDFKKKVGEGLVLIPWYNIYIFWKFSYWIYAKPLKAYSNHRAQKGGLGNLRGFYLSVFDKKKKMFARLNARKNREKVFAKKQSEKNLKGFKNGSTKKKARKLFLNYFFGLPPVT